MISKLILTALLLISTITSCNSENGLRWLGEEIATPVPEEIVEPNRDSIYFSINSQGIIEPLDYDALPPDLIIPREVDGIEVQKVTGCEESPVRFLTIQEGVTVAGSAFSDCPYLEKVVFTSGVVKVSDSAFSGCTALNRVEVYCSYSAISPVAFDTGCSAEFVYGGVTYEGFDDFMGLAHGKDTV